MKETITKQDVVDLLNEFLKLDPQAAEELMFYRAVCNKAVEEHPTIQVRVTDESDVYFAVGADHIARIGFIGLLNGMFGVDGDDNGAIGMIIDEGEILTGFGLIN